MSEHILFAVNNYPPHSGGVEQHVFQLATHLVQLGHQCTVVTLADAASDTVEHGARVIREPSWGNIGSVLSFPRFGAKRRLKKLIAATGVTAVSVHTRFFPLTWVGVAAARSSGLPSILTEHGSAHVRGVSRAVGWASWWVDVTLGRRVLRNTTVRLAVSAESAAFVRKLSGKTAEVFANATDVEFWSDAAPQPASRYVFVGRLVPGKGWRESIQAFERAHSSPDAALYELHLVGDGPELETAIPQAAASPASAHIKVHGRQTHDQLRSLLSGQWLLNPTTLAEGFQTTLLEAAAAKAGIISYPTPGLGELEASGATVLRANSIEQLAEQMRVARTLTPAELHRDSLEQWGWPVRAQQYADIVARARSKEAR